jgi:hypothetical protein
MSKFFRQLGDKTQKLGRQISGDTMKLGRQISGAVSLLPQAYKDTSKVYGDIEKATSKLGVPVVPEVFGFAKDATGGIGNLLSGNFDRGVSQGMKGLNRGTGLMEKAILFG